MRLPQRHKIKSLREGNLRPKINPWSAFIVVVSLVAFYGLLPQLKQLSGTVAAVRTASPLWIAAGIVMVALLFLASGYTQYVVCRGVGSYKRLTILELTGAFLDHFLPFNSGSVSLIAKYYHQRGMVWARALTVALLPTIFGMIITVSLILVISPVTLSHLFHRAYDAWVVALLIGIVLLAAACVVILFAPLRVRARSFMASMVTAINGITLWPQFAQIALGCLVLRFSGGVALAFSVYAVHASITLIDAFTLFVAAQIVTNVSPTPGGLGTTETFLAFGLVSVGVDLAHAIAATLIFRLIIFWLPIIPGLVAVRLAYRWQLTS